MSLALFAGLSKISTDSINPGIKTSPLEVHIFSKHLQFLNIEMAAQVAAEMGFAGLDLTVRPNGHILPERVQSDLPNAVEAVNRVGLTCKMITTAIADAKSSVDKNVITTASSLGIKYYRSNWFTYLDDHSLEDSLQYYSDKLEQLSKLNKEYNLIGCYQNHSGLKIGASVWEVNKILEHVDPDHFGVQYDIRHAVVEGGRSWPNGVRLMKDRIKTIVLKDFKWGKVNGQWQIINVPIGEGMVDFRKYFQILKEYELAPPVSLHVEYPIGGAEKGKSKIEIPEEQVFQAMEKDLLTIQKLWLST